jgi:hypothetical protein
MLSFRTYIIEKQIVGRVRPNAVITPATATSHGFLRAKSLPKPGVALDLPNTLLI